MFDQIFSWPVRILPFYTAFLLIIDVVSQRWTFVPLCLLVFVLPVYLLRRRRLLRCPELNLLMSEKDDIKDRLALEGLGAALMWIFLMLSVTVVVEAVQSFWERINFDLFQMVLMALISSAVMMMIIVRSVQRFPGLRLKPVLGLTRGRLSALRIFIIPALLGVAVAALSSKIILSRAVQPDTPLSQALSANQSPELIGIFIGIAVLLAPFLEEIIFRGYFFFIIRSVRGKWFAFAVISFIFGLMHVEQYWTDWAAISMVFMLGVILALLRIWNNTSISSIITHYAYNGSMVLIPLLAVYFTNPLYYEYQMRYTLLDNPAKEELLLESVSKYPLHAPSYNDLAWLYAKEGRELEYALELADKALDLNPNDYAFLDTKAEVLYRMKRFEEAINIAEGLLSQYPDDPYINNQLEKFRNAVENQNLTEERDWSYRG